MPKEHMIYLSYEQVRALPNKIRNAFQCFAPLPDSSASPTLSDTQFERLIECFSSVIEIRAYRRLSIKYNRLVGNADSELTLLSFLNLEASSGDDLLADEISYIKLGKNGILPARFLPSCWNPLRRKPLLEDPSILQQLSTQPSTPIASPDQPDLLKPVPERGGMSLSTIRLSSSQMTILEPYKESYKTKLRTFRVQFHEHTALYLSDELFGRILQLIERNDNIFEDINRKGYGGELDLIDLLMLPADDFKQEIENWSNYCENRKLDQRIQLPIPVSLNARPPSSDIPSFPLVPSLPEKNIYISPELEQELEELFRQGKGSFDYINVYTNFLKTKPDKASKLTEAQGLRLKKLVANSIQRECFFWSCNFVYAGQLRVGHILDLPDEQYEQLMASWTQEYAKRISVKTADVREGRADAELTFSTNPAINDRIDKDILRIIPRDPRAAHQPGFFPKPSENPEIPTNFNPSKGF